ncbi:UUP1 family membrane protein [Luteolibacter sp. AS25]|uniref:UUP1 family membrane protein n=1 Tax=Luteolibacter sp. AS25 TaxID=3135776 RepID=UPI00398AEDAF
MSAQAKLLSAVVALIVIGGGLAAYKTQKLGVPFWEDQGADEWLVEAKVSFLATGRPVKASLSLPEEAVVGKGIQESGSLGYHFDIEDNRGEYTAIWSANERDDGQALYYRVRFKEGLASGGEATPANGEPDVPDVPILPGSLARAAESIVKRAQAVAADNDTFFVALFNQVSTEKSSQEYLLIKRHYERERLVNPDIAMAIELLGMAKIPARIAYGISLNEENSAQAPIPLLEYYDGAAWKVRDPSQPSKVLDGRDIFVWHRGGGPLLEVNGGENSRVTFTVVKDRIPLSRLTDLQESPLLISTILALPASERAVFRYIVLIPLGAFVVVLMRNIIGVPTLGTFMPVLLALALLEIKPLQGIMMFSILVGVGLWFRFLLSRMNLLVVPRVAACVVIVTLLMMLMGVISYQMGMSVGIKITLFPMIIIAWTLERMSLIWEEEGKRSAIVQVSGSVFVAVCAYYFMKVSQIQYWAFYFPELLLVLLASILLVGRYTGYRLSELIRFKTFTNA